MKKLWLLIALLLPLFLVVACDDANTDTENESMVSSLTTTSLYPETKTIDDILYDLHYVGDGFAVYKRHQLLEVGTTDVVDLGVYMGRLYWFSMGTDYRYYRVIKDEEIKLLKEAMDLGWFTIDQAIDNFNMIELYSISLDDIETETTTTE